MIRTLLASLLTVALLAGTAAAEPRRVVLPSVWSPAESIERLQPAPGEVEQWLRKSGVSGDSDAARWLAAVALRDKAAPDVLPATSLAALLASAQRQGEMFLIHDAARHKLYTGNREAGMMIADWNGAHPTVASLYHFPTRTEFVSRPQPGGSLWEVAFRPGGPDALWTSAAARTAPRCAVRPGAGGWEITMQWPSQQAGGLPGEAAVTAEIRLLPTAPLAEFRLSVEHRIKDAGLWAVVFPKIGGVGYPGATDATAGTLGTSRLVRRCDQAITDHLWAEQTRAITCGPATLYLAAEDPAHVQKYYEFRPGGDLSVRLVPADTGKPGVSYHQGFPIRLGPIKGDWFDAAQLYRQWAARQPWMSRGPVEGWVGPGKKMAAVSLWAQTLSPSANNVPATVDRLTALQKSIGVNGLGVHYYQWWKGDAFSPGILANGYRAGLPGGWKNLADAGMHVLPYFNVLYWKLGSGTFASSELAPARPAACRPAPGTEGDNVAGERFKVEEDYYLVGKNRMVPMCRLTPFWQEHLVALARQMADAGNDMVYLDQGGVPPRSPCFDPAHGHPLGGGSQWAEGTREIVRRIKHDTGRELAVCCEGAYEGYLDLTELQFIHYWPWLAPADALCPVFESIYHGDTLFVGAVKPHRDATAFAIDVGTRLLHGHQFRMVTSLFEDPAQQDQAAFISRLARLRQESLPFLAAGRLVRPPDWRQAPGTVTADWLVKDDKTESTIQYPALERSAFTDAAGNRAVFIVNFDTQPHPAALALDAWKIPKNAKLVLVRSSSSRSSVAADEPLTIPARDGVMLLFER